MLYNAEKFTSSASTLRMRAKRLISQPFPSILTNGYKRKVLDVFHNHGAIILANCTKDNERYLDPIKIRSSCANIFSEYLSLATEQFGELGLGKANGFRELVMKDLGRYDLNLDHLCVNPNAVKKRRSLTSNETKMQEAKDSIVDIIAPVLAIILEDEYRLNALGTVVSHPGTSAQRWHVDSSHLFRHSVPGIDLTLADISVQHSMELLPCHFVTVFFPLYEYSDAIGPTEVALGSHRRTSVLHNSTVEDQYPKDPVVDWIIGDDNAAVKTAKIDCDIGDIGTRAFLDTRTLSI